MDAYAVIETGGKQYLVHKGSQVDVERLAGEPGASITINRVLAFSNGNELKVGTPVLEGGEVTASIIRQFRGEKVVAFRKKRRKGYHKKRGHRQDLTRIKIESIGA